MPIETSRAEPGSPAWWLGRLSTKLEDRLQELQKLDAYYEGNQTIRYAMERWRKAFARQFRHFSENAMPLVVDSVEERIDIVGFKVDGKFDAKTWDIWQDNHMDAESQIAHTESLTLSESYGMVWNSDRSTTEAHITIESPYEMIVEFVPGSRWERAAACKVWKDEISGLLLATVYLPDAIYKYRSSQPVSDNTYPTHATWELRSVPDEDWPVPNPLGAVPVVPLQNRPRLRRPPRSEMADVLGTQDAINKLTMDLLVASEFAAFRQRYIIGARQPTDPETGEVIPDVWKQALEEFLFVPNEQAKVGSIEATDLKNYVVAIEHEIQQVATRTKTPPHYFFLRGEFPSGESIVAAEAGLVSKAMRRMSHWADSWEELMRMARVIEQASDPEARIDTMWRDPESRTESQHIDAVGKKREMLEIPLEQAWEDAGYTPEQIARMKVQHAAEKAEAQAAAAALVQQAGPGDSDQGGAAGEQEG